MVGRRPAAGLDLESGLEVERGRRRLRNAAMHVAFIPEWAPHANTYAERFVRSIKENASTGRFRLVERHFRCARRSTSSISRRTESPGKRQSAHLRPARKRDRESRERRSRSVAAQLLSASVIVRSAEGWNTRDFRARIPGTHISTRPEKDMRTSAAATALFVTFVLSISNAAQDRPAAERFHEAIRADDIPGASRTDCQGRR